MMAQQGRKGEQQVDSKRTRQSVIAEIKQTLAFGETHDDIADVAAAQTETLKGVLDFLKRVTVTPHDLLAEAAEMSTDDLAKAEYGPTAQIALVQTRRTRKPWSAQVVAIPAMGAHPEVVASSNGNGMIECLAGIRSLLVDLYTRPVETRNH